MKKPIPKLTKEQLKAVILHGETITIIPSPGKGKMIGNINLDDYTYEIINCPPSMQIAQ